MVDHGSSLGLDDTETVADRAVYWLSVQFSKLPNLTHRNLFADRGRESAEVVQECRTPSLGDNFRGAGEDCGVAQAAVGYNDYYGMSHSIGPFVSNAYAAGFVPLSPDLSVWTSGWDGNFAWTYLEVDPEIAVTGIYVAN